MTLTIRDKVVADSDWIADAIASEWGSCVIVSRGRLHQTDKLTAIVAERDGRAAGLLTYRIDENELEIVTVQAFAKRAGVGTALLLSARKKAEQAGCRRMWLVTTNDNVTAMAFYKAMGMSLTAVHIGAITEARRLKPEIPAIGANGVPIQDEHEFELLLQAQRS